VLVNASRGGLVDEEALAAFLNSHPRAAAYLDCFETEPYRGPLCQLPNAFLTAHIGSYAREARERMEREAVENLLRALGRL
jgi:D-3-phosphoglycerate dehydrogenase